MSDLEVTPNALNQLATTDEQTSVKIGTAAAATNGISTDLWVTHGVVCEKLIYALTDAESARRSLVEAMQVFAHELAAKLDKAADAYVGADEQAAHNIDTQVQTV